MNGYVDELRRHFVALLRIFYDGPYCVVYDSYKKYIDIQTLTCGLTK